MDNEPRRRHRGLAGPLILVGLGVIFLLSNFGLLGSSAWDAIFRLWPLFLILLGIDILLGRRSGGSLLAALSLLVLVLLVVGAVGFVVAYPAQSTFGRGYSYESWNENSAGLQPHVTTVTSSLHTESLAQSTEDASKAEIELSTGVGRITLGAMKEADGLIDGTVELGQNNRLVKEFHVSNDTAYLKVHDEAMPPFTGDNHRGDSCTWDVAVNPDLPVGLKIHSGVGEANIDLSDLKVTDLQVSSGVGNTELTLPRAGQLRAKIDGGIGQVRVSVPRGMAMRITVEKGLTNLNVSSRFRHQGNSYLSQGYESATDRVELLIKGGIGEISVQEIDTRQISS